MEFVVFFIILVVTLLGAAGNAVTAGQTIRTQFPSHRNSVPILTGKTLFRGTMAFVIPASGYATDVIATNVNIFAGIVADKDWDNTAGASGALRAEVYTQGRFILNGSGFTQAALEAKVYAVDNYTISLTPTNQPFIGICKEVISSTELLVEIVTGSRTP